MACDVQRLHSGDVGLHLRDRCSAIATRVTVLREVRCLTELARQAAEDRVEAVLTLILEHLVVRRFDPVGDLRPFRETFDLVDRRRVGVKALLMKPCIHVLVPVPHELSSPTGDVQMLVKPLAFQG